MHKIKILNIMLAASLLAFTSCSNDDELEEMASHSLGKGSVTLSFDLSMGEDVATRSMKSDDNNGDTISACWTTDDEVTVGITHYDNGTGSTTYKNVTVNNISDDGLRAYVSLTVDASKVATNDSITVIYPAVEVSDGAISSATVLNYTEQNGSVEGLKDFDIRSGKSALVVTDATATLSSDLVLSPMLTAYIGVVCQDASGGAINVKEMTVRPADSYEDPAWYTWRSRSSYGEEGVPDETYPGGSYDDNGFYNEYWGALMVTKSEASTGRTYIAMPIVNSGDTAVYTAITSDGKVYAAKKVWTGEAGNYYPVTMQMAEVTVPDHVDLGLSAKWATFDCGMTSEFGYTANYYAYAEISGRTGHQIAPNRAGWTWKYSYLTSPYQTNQDESSYGDYGSNTTWRKYGPSHYTLDPCDDVATVMYGSKWRMPTAVELAELVDGVVDYPSVTINGEDVRIEGSTSHEIRWEEELEGINRNYTKCNIKRSTTEDGQAYYTFTNLTNDNSIKITSQGCRMDNSLNGSSQLITGETYDLRRSSQLTYAVNYNYSGLSLDLMLYLTPVYYPLGSTKRYRYLYWYYTANQLFTGCPVRPVYVGED